MAEYVQPIVNRRCAVLALAALALLAGCVNPAFRETTAAFGTLTKQAADVQTQRLQAATAAHRSAIMDQMAANRERLTLSQGCRERLDTASLVGTGRAPSGARGAAPTCQLLTNGRPIADASNYENIIALNGALSAYAQSLARLGGDFTADEAAFSTSLAGVAGSVGRLHQAVATAGGAAAADPSNRLGGVATVIAQAGNLYAAHARDRALRRIVQANDPAVQEAVRLLSSTEAPLMSGERLRLFNSLEEALEVHDLLMVNARASREQIRAAQERVVAATSLYNAHGSGIPTFRAVGSAHAALARAAAEGASARELAAAIEALVDLGGAAGTAYGAWSGATEGASDAD